MKKFLKPMAILLAMSILGGTALTGCGTKKENIKENTKIEQKEDKKEEAKEEKFVNDKYIVDAEWLKDNLNNESVIILDARSDKAYNKGHITGAINVAWQQFANIQGKSSDKGWGNILDAEQLSEKLSAIGVDENKTVIVYCDTNNGWGDDGRIIWMLNMAGIKNAKMLDGGIEYWNNKAYAISTEAVQPKTSEYKVEKLDMSMNITTEELKDKLGKVVILDSREKDEYEGATKYGEVRGGHIQGAINLTFNKLLKEDGTFKSPSEIQAMLDEIGLKKDSEIVTYCTAGIRSAHLAMALKMMGYENVKNYDSSFYAWAADESLEIEK